MPPAPGFGSRKNPSYSLPRRTGCERHSSVHRHRAEVQPIPSERACRSPVATCFRGAGGTGTVPGPLGELGERVLVINPESATDLLARLQGLETLVISKSVVLVVVDSIAALARTDFGREQLSERQQLLGQQAAALKYVAESFRIPIVVTNQVMGAGFGEVAGEAAAKVTAALGLVWAHASNTRLVLEAGRGKRYIRIAKSPVAPTMSFAFRITTAGLQLEEGREGEGVLLPPGSVLGMTFAAELPYNLPAADQ
eukprot:jgi/Botrbrau1/5425/Bobra.182_1s0027.1